MWYHRIVKVRQFPYTYRGGNVRRGSITFFLALLATLPGGGCRQDQPTVIIEVATPATPPATLTRDENFQFMLDSYGRTGELHTMTLCGNFQELVQVQHWGIMMDLERLGPHPAQRRTGCSMFQCRPDSGTTLLGRNFDHKYSELLAAWCYPDSGYASLCFIPMNQLGFTEQKRFEAEDPQQKRRLLSSPVTAIEGMNEKGVVITLASLEPQTLVADPAKEPRFLIHLVREILDHAGTLDQAVAIASRYNIFDNGRDIISHHIFLADPTGGSAVLEWKDGQMQVLPSGPNPQIVTNTPMINVPESNRRDSCRRYRTLANTLDQPGGGFGWQEGINALQRTAQYNVLFILEGERWRVSTQWSAVFDLARREVYVCLGRDFGTVYKLKGPSG